MIFVLLAALAVGVACYFGIDALGTAAIDRWYLSDDAIAARNLAHERSLQEYVSTHGVSSRDTLAIEQWSRGEKKANVIVYQAEGDPYEAGSWGTSELLDDTTQSDIADLGYSFFTVQFADGEYRVAVCDYSEAWLYSYVSFGALVLGFVICSWAVGTLMDSEGTLRQMFDATAYALCPYILTQIAAVLLSNVIVLREQAFLTVDIVD